MKEILTTAPVKPKLDRLTAIATVIRGQLDEYVNQCETPLQESLRLNIDSLLEVIYDMGMEDGKHEMKRTMREWLQDNA